MSVKMKPNPLKAILRQIPETLTIVDLDFADKITEVILKRTKMVVNNKCVLVILSCLADSGLIYMTEVPSDVLGKIFIIKRL